MKRLLFMVFALLLITTTAQAQTVPDSIQDLAFKVSIENPTPGQEITISAESYTLDLSSANTIWTLNGSVYQKGTGITSINAVAPELGKKLTVGLTASISGGRELKASIDIGSGGIDMIFENQGYTPPFFQGKIPVSYQNTYRIIAIPHLANSSGKEYDPKTLIYQWTKDSKAAQDQSGYGKQVFAWQDEVIPRQRIISLRVVSKDGNAQAEKALIFQAKDPLLYFYKNDPLYGPLYNSIIGERVGLGSNKEVSIIAVPFGFNKPLNDKGSLSFMWLVNSIEQAALSASQSIVLRAPAEKSGISEIQLQIRNTKDILQRAMGGFSAVFSANQATSTINNYNGI